MSIELSSKISDYSVYDIEEVATLIKVEIKFLLKDIMLEYSTQQEREYLKLLEEQSKNIIRLVYSYYRQTCLLLLFFVLLLQVYNLT